MRTVDTFLVFARSAGFVECAISYERQPDIAIADQESHRERSGLKPSHKSQSFGPTSDSRLVGLPCHIQLDRATID
jgi:hypothetical protein